MIRHALIFVACAALAACATQPGQPAPKPLTPAQQVFAIQSDYDTALSLAIAYKMLPPCPGAVLCSDAATVTRIQAADQAANDALQAAQAQVRNGTNAGTLAADVVAAQSAVSAFQTIANSLKVK
jgi:hypothetical protein